MKTTIRKKLNNSFILIFLLLFLTALLSIISLKSAIKNMQKVILINQMLQFELLKLENNIIKEINVTKDIISFGDNEYLTKKKYTLFYKLKQDNKNLITNIKNKYFPLIENKNLKKEMEDLLNKKNKVDKILEKTISIYKSKNKNEAFNYLSSSNLMKIYNEINLVSIKNRNYYNTVFNSAISKKENIIYIISIIFIIVILIAIFVTNTIVKKFTENIKYLIISAENVSLGELDSPIEISKNGELEDISKIFEYLRIEIKKNIEEIKKLRQ